MLIGLISDTHGHLPESAKTALSSCDRIIHAGDIGSLAVLMQLECIAPVTAVLGNCDYADYGFSVRHTARPVFDGIPFYVTHRPRDIYDTGDAEVIVHGHTHKRREERDGGVLIVNPGSASAPRDGLAPSVCILETAPGFVRSVRFVDLA